MGGPELAYAGAMNEALPFMRAEAQSVDLKALITYEKAGILSRTLFSDERLRVVFFSISQGQELTEHTNARRAFVQVVDGSCLFLYNGDWRRLETGSFLHMPPRHPHAVKADQGPCSFLLILEGLGGAEEQD